MTSQDGCAKNQTDLAWFVTAGVQAGRALTAAIAETDAGVKFLRQVVDLLGRLRSSLNENGGLLTFARGLDAVLSQPRAIDYEHRLIEVGRQPTDARLLSYFIVKLAPQYAAERTSERRRIASILRRLKAAKSPIVISRRAADLLPLAESNSTGLLMNALEDSALPLTLENFRELLRAAAGGDRVACVTLRKLSPQLFDAFPKARGKALSPATAAHAMLLFLSKEAGLSGAHTYCPYEEAHVDRGTLATRRQFQQQSFSPTGVAPLLRDLQR